MTSNAGGPRVVLIDLDHWDAFASFAPSLRRRGVGVVRIAAPRAGRTRALGGFIDRLVFGRSRLAADDHTSVAAALAGVLVAPTVDVLGPEDVIESLRESVSWSAHPVVARVPDGDHVRLLFDKLAMDGFASSIPVATPRTWAHQPDAVLPLVVKGRSGAGGRVVRVARTSEEVSAAVHALAPLAPRGIFFQELVEGVLTNVGGVADQGRLVSSCCYRAIPRDDDPLGPPEVIEVVESPGIDASLPPLLEALRYSGMFCIDYIVRPDGEAVLIDFNPRIFGGWLALQTAGTDLLGAYLRLFGHAGTPSDSKPALHGRYSVRLLPRAGAESWRAWASRLRHSGGQLRRASRVTGASFTLAMSLRALLISGGDAVRLARRGPGHQSPDRRSHGV